MGVLTIDRYSRVTRQLPQRMKPLDAVHPLRWPNESRVRRVDRSERHGLTGVRLLFSEGVDVDEVSSRTGVMLS